MSTKSSPARVMAWNWVIQSLAKFKQVDSSTLVGLVKKPPAVSDDLGKDAREMISLRILESLFINGNEATVDTDSAQNAKISFDPSEHCEDVLHKILEETSEPMTESERQKWNIRSFLMHKRASLPKSPLQKLKEALLEGSHPLLASLKDRNKLGGSSVSENTSPAVNVSFDAQTPVTKDDSVSLNPANENNKLQEPPLQKSNDEDDSTRGVTEHIGRKEHEMSIEPPVKGLEENILMDDDQHTISKKLEQSSHDANLEHVQQKPSGNDDNVPQDTIRDSHDKRVSIENVRELETVSDSDGSDDERTATTAKKEAFLSSQWTLSQDSMGTDLCLCMKCYNVGGQLLVCSSDACSFRVHENCVGSAATLDENGKFLCPFCAYSHAISKYLEVKEKASLARKDLQAFLSTGVKYRPSEKGDSVSRGKEDCLPSCGEKGGSLGNAENLVLAEPSTMEEHLPPFKEPCGQHGDVDLTNGCLNQPTTDSVHQPIRQPRMPRRQYNEKESPMSSNSRRSRKRKPQPQYTSPTIPFIGRKKLQWTKAEEEILKEGVQRFSNGNRKGIPWREILDFGRDVLDKSRTAIDLKDKWRNMCKGSSGAKKQKL